MKNREKKIKDTTVLTIRKLIKERRLKTLDAVKKCQEYKEFMLSSKVNKYEREKEDTIIDGILNGYSDDEIILMCKPDIGTVPAALMEDIKNLSSKTNEGENEMTKVVEKNNDELAWFEPVKDDETDKKVEKETMPDDTNTKDVKEENVSEVSNNYKPTYNNAMMDMFNKLDKFTEKFDLNKDDVNIDVVKEFLKGICDVMGVDTTKDNTEIPDELKDIITSVTNIIVRLYDINKELDTDIERSDIMCEELDITDKAATKEVTEIKSEVVKTDVVVEDKKVAEEKPKKLFGSTYLAELDAKIDAEIEFLTSIAKKAV